MTYAEVLLACRDYRCILVTGPQRSGTTIAAECLAADLGVPCVREEVFGVGTVGPGGSVASWWRLVLAGEPGAIQCPTMSAFVHHTPDEWAVVWMVRPVEEIEASERRIGWDGSRVELDRYFHADDGSIARVKCLNWGQFQREPLGDRALELDYHSLAGHSLWVPADRRRGFGPRQTRE